MAFGGYGGQWCGNRESLLPTRPSINRNSLEKWSTLCLGRVGAPLSQLRV